MTSTCDHQNLCLKICGKILSIFNKERNLTLYDLVEIIEIVTFNVLRDNLKDSSIKKSRKVRAQLAKISEILTEIVE